MHTLSFFIFRRDLRLEDNTALIKALTNSKSVLPLFFLDPRQLNSPYKSETALSFMLEALKELNGELQKKGSRLYLFYGKCEEELTCLIQKHSPEAIYINKDYTPFSLKRDQAIEKLCKCHQVDFHSEEDALLLPPHEALTDQGTPYKVFSPFFRKVKAFKVAKPKSNSNNNYFKEAIEKCKDMDFLDTVKKSSHTNHIHKGGRKFALKILKNLGRFKNYNEDRNFPFLEGTSKLSPHHKFGTISIREAYFAIANQLGCEHTLIQELYWRDFFTHVLFHFPYVLGKSFHQKYDTLKWGNSPKLFKSWCDGQTGFPIVDAGMRELNQSGWMHNRVRMITASFLVKDLHVDWKWGEKYFAQKLVDYDPAVNNGNWQWAASTGCDAQPYFRIFNPWRQQKKFDPDCIYIKKWIPELKDYSPKKIHDWDGSFDYPAPIIDHSKESQKTKDLYANCKN